MTPGTIIEWRYTSSSTPVGNAKIMWSIAAEREVLIGGFYLLISHVDGVMTWLPLGHDKLCQMHVTRRTQHLVYPCEAVSLMEPT